MTTDIIFNVNNSDTLIVLIISSTVAVVAAISLLLDIKFWPEMNGKEKRDNNSKSKNKQRKTNISKKKKIHKLRQHKNSANILIKLI